MDKNSVLYKKSTRKIVYAIFMKCNKQITIIVETINENWLWNKLIKPDINDKYKEFLYLRYIKENKCIFNLYDLDYLYKIYDLLQVKQKKHKIVFCYSYPYVG